MDVKPASRPPNKHGWFDRQMEHHNKGVHGLRALEPHLCAADLLQNCVLPPPLKLFSPVEDDDKRNKLATICSTPFVTPNSLPTPAPRANQWDDEWGLSQGGENSSLLRALRLSQTRAREAKKKASLANARSEQMALLLLEDSLRLSAHRRWERLLEIEVSMLRKKMLWSEKEERAEDDAAPAAATWCLALALCLGIGGAGFALGRCMF